MEIYGIVVAVLAMGYIPYLAQWKLYDTVNDKMFKLIKVKKLAFLFCGVSGESVSKHGMIKGLFAIQVTGYVFALLSTVAAIILPLVFKVDLRTTMFILFIALGVLVVALVIVIIITGIISKRRENKARY